MTKEEAIDELSVLYERCTKARQFPNKFYCSLTDGQYIDALDMAIKALEEQPEVGEWLKRGELCKCSGCGNMVLLSVVKSYSYCNRCGAKMEVSE